MTGEKIYSRIATWNMFNWEEWDRDKETPFRTCKATVGTTTSGEFTYLRSYNTIVCIIDNVTGIAVDILRAECGYTATSSQHISKFLKDYAHKHLFIVNIDRKGEYYTQIY